MKKQIYLMLLVIVNLGFSNSIQAQCIADPQYTEVGVWPAVFPVFCQNVAYDETVTFIYPNDTCVSLLGPCTVIDLSKITITSIENLPPGVDYECPNAECDFFPNGNAGENTASCLQVSGTPTQAGTFTVTVRVTIIPESFLPPVDYDYGFDMTITPEGQGDCIPTGINSSSVANQLTLSPNPTSDAVQLSKTITFGVVKNTEGTTVLTLKNVDSIDMSSLSSGLYLLITEEETLKIIKE